MTVSVPAQAYADAYAADAELAPVLLAIARYESSWNPRAIGDGGTSFGYLQLHTPGGVGDGYTREQLLDGPTNMRIGAGAIRARLNAGASLWDALQPWSVRPKAWTLLQQFEREGVAPDAGTVSGSQGSVVSASPWAPHQDNRTGANARTLALVVALALGALFAFEVI